jgi:trk system potassium uptake protein TrkA
MRVVVIGAGQVGQSIAQALENEHDVVVIERDRRPLELVAQYDVMTLEGNGASLKVLQQAEVDRADLVIACTNIDEVNIVACAASKQLGAAFTIARVHDTEYIETWERGRLGVDFMVCSELLTSEVMAQLIGIPAAREIHAFAEGRVILAELLIDAASGLANRSIHSLQLPENCMIASLVRGGKVIIPTGEDVIRSGDLMVSVGVPAAVARLNRLASRQATPEGIVIIGGGRIGYRLAATLEEQDLKPKVIEADPERSRWLAEQLPHSEVFQSSGIDLEFLESERIGECQVGACVMDRDEKNLLSALLLKSLGVKKVIAGVADTHFVKVFERVGIDVAVSARQVIAEEIIRFTQSKIAGVSVLEGDRAEVLEVTISHKSPLAGVLLKDSPLPRGEAIVGAIVRKKQVIIPHGEDRIQAGDLLLIFSVKEVASEVERLL